MYNVKAKKKKKKKKNLKKTNYGSDLQLRARVGRKPEHKLFFFFFVMFCVFHCFFFFSFLFFFFVCLITKIIKRVMACETA